MEVGLTNRIAIVVSSHTGQTEKIAQGMAEQLRVKGAEVDIFNLESQDGPSLSQLKSYEGVIVGAPLYMGDFPEKLLDWTGAHYVELRAMNTGLFTVSLNAADKSSKARLKDDRMLKKFVQRAELSPRFVVCLAGTLAYTKYSFFKRFMLQGMGAASAWPTDTNLDHDMTDWHDVYWFLEAFQLQDGASQFAAINRLPWTPDVLWPLGLQRVG